MHRRLKEEAARAHRSMIRQALVLLEQVLPATFIRPGSCPIRSYSATQLAYGDVIAVLSANRTMPQSKT
ncbi:MAG: hypothetical protein ACXWTW_04505 [Methylobacter sp.]